MRSKVLQARYGLIVETCRAKHRDIIWEGAASALQAFGEVVEGYKGRQISE
jgi:hypothetical protein